MGTSISYETSLKWGESRWGNSYGSGPHNYLIIIRDERPFLLERRQYHGRLRIFACLCVFLSQQIISKTKIPQLPTHHIPTIFTNHFGSDLPPDVSKVEEEEAEEVEVEEEPPKAELTPEAHQNTCGWKGSQELGVGLYLVG